MILRYSNSVIFHPYPVRSQSTDVFDVVCKGCPVCDDCPTSRGVPACAEELDHTESTGGNATIQDLEIDPGYWRATNTSKKVLKCYNSDACSGGITGASTFCSTGYEGPCENSIGAFAYGNKSKQRGVHDWGWIGIGYLPQLYLEEFRFTRVYQRVQAGGS